MILVLCSAVVYGGGRTVPPAMTAASITRSTTGQEPEIINTVRCDTWC